MSRAEATFKENLAWRIRRHADVIRAHDAIHPDRGDCGGVGNCALMATEHDTEVEIVECLEHGIRQGFEFGVV
jgi:hypothetical protein